MAWVVLIGTGAKHTGHRPITSMSATNLFKLTLMNMMTLKLWSLL